jgi:hypothetical protein
MRANAKNRPPRRINQARENAAKERSRNVDKLQQALNEEKARLRAVIEDARKRLAMIDGIGSDLGADRPRATNGARHPAASRRHVVVRVGDVTSALACATKPMRAYDVSKALGFRHSMDRRVHQHLSRLKIRGLASGDGRGRFWLPTNALAKTAAEL